MMESLSELNNSLSSTNTPQLLVDISESVDSSYCNIPEATTLTGRVTCSEFLVESESLSYDDDYDDDDDDDVSSGRTVSPCVDANCRLITPMEFFPSNGRITPTGYLTPINYLTPISSGRATPNTGYKTPLSGRNSPGCIYSPMAVRKQIVNNDYHMKLSKVSPESDQDDKDEVQRKLEAGEDLYPNCDESIWLRTCREEVIEPLHGEVTGCVPKWLSGTLLRNGPGSLQVGDMRFEHLFDSSALLHRFAIHEGEVTYQNRFLKSETYKRNHAAQRIVVTEFGTKAVPDPCQSIFQRVSAIFHPGEGSSDNAMISVYPFGDEFYTFTESPVIHRIDPKTLETFERVNVCEHVSIVNHTSHPHVTEDGTVYNLGMTVTATGPSYAIVKFPPPYFRDVGSERVSPFSQAKIVGTVRARWRFNPSYMHTFGITENFFIIVEQPMSVSVPHLIKNQLRNEPLNSSLKWHQDKQTLIHVMGRFDGKLHKTFVAETFFFLHVINTYEEGNHVVLDICCYKDPSMLDCMYIDSLKSMQSNPDYARMFRGRPLRFVLPLDPPLLTKPDMNLVTLPGAEATAYKLSRGKIIVKPELLCDLGCETPRINYEKNLGKKYRYFYAISSDVDLDNPGTLIKVDIQTRTRKTWCEDNMYPSEPIFVPSPDPKSEDDGVVVSALVWGGQGMEDQAGLLILDAITWTELARAQFTTPSPVPKCLHGWFTSTVH